MTFPQSIRWRLQLWYGLLLLAVLCGFGFTTFQWERSRQMRALDESFRIRTSVLLKALKASPLKGPNLKAGTSFALSPEQGALFAEGSGYYYVIWLNDPEPLAISTAAPSKIPKPDPKDSTFRVRGDYREEILFAAPVNCLLVGRSIAPERRELANIALGLFAIGGTILAAGLVVGWRLVSLAIRPIHQISDTAAKIASGDLSQRIQTGDTDTELGQLASVLNSTFSRLEKAFERQAQFTADAAHELRTPLAVILTQTQSALLRERPATEYRETLEAVQRAAQRMRRLSESLLELARLDAGKETLLLEECDLAKLSTDCVGLLKPLAEARNIQLHLETSNTKLIGDSTRLNQVLTALISNAIDYNREGGSVTVSVRREDRGAVVSVTDTGLGIAQEDLPHIFDRFYRANKSRESKSGHSGLGLAITAAIVQAHGGRIEVTSQPEKGSTFSVILP